MKRNNKNEKYDKQIIIIGAGGHSVSVANVALSAGYKIKCFVDKFKKSKSNLLGYKIIKNLADIENQEKYNYAIAIGDNYIRENIYKELLAEVPEQNFPKLIHSSATISLYVEIGNGSVIMPNAVIGPNSKVGKLCIINTNASIDHDCLMQDYSSLAPGVVTGGDVIIGKRTSISIGATIRNKIKIGNDTVVGANSYVNKELLSNIIAYGAPAKKIRTRNLGDSYLV